MPAYIIYQDFFFFVFNQYSFGILNAVKRIEVTLRTNPIWGHILPCLSGELTPNMVKTSQKRSERVTCRNIQSQHHTSLFSRTHDGSASACKTAGKAKNGCRRKQQVTHLAQRQHHEGSPSTGVHNHGHKFRVNGAKVAVPRHLRDSDVIVALVGFHGLAEDVTELAVPNETSGHGGLEAIRKAGWGARREW